MNDFDKSTAEIPKDPTDADLALPVNEEAAENVVDSLSSVGCENVSKEEGRCEDQKLTVVLSAENDIEDVKDGEKDLEIVCEASTVDNDNSLELVKEKSEDLDQIEPENIATHNELEQQPAQVVTKVDSEKISISPLPIPDAVPMEEKLESKPIESQLVIEKSDVVKTDNSEPMAVNREPIVEVSTQLKEIDTMTAQQVVNKFQTDQLTISKTFQNISVKPLETLIEKLPLVKELTIKRVEDKKGENCDVEIDMRDLLSKNGNREDQKSAVPPTNGDSPKDTQATKRRQSSDVDTESPLKKLCLEVEKSFPQHDGMINDYIQTATKNNIDEIQRHTEQLLSEIQTLRELAQKKEHEWNNILHLKKVKEEILLRLLRRKQVISFEKSGETNGSERVQDPFDYLNQSKSLAIDKNDELLGLSLKQAGPIMNSPMMSVQNPMMPVSSHYNPMAGLPPPYDKAPHMQPMPKPVYPQGLMMPGPTMQGFPRDMNGQLHNFGLPMGRQGPTKDVKSIIADYRQRNPDITPRRGRRMKSMLNPNMMNIRPIAPKMDSMGNLTGLSNMNNLNNLNNLSMIFNNLDMNQKAMLERLQQMQGGALPNGLSFKDVLVQFASMQQANPGLMPNRPPDMMSSRPEHHMRPDMKQRRPERMHEDMHMQPSKSQERLASPSPRLPPPPPYPEISLVPVTSSQDIPTSQNSLLHGILTKQTTPAPTQSFSPTLAKLLSSPDRKHTTTPTLPTFGQAKNCGEITITPVQPTPPPPETPQQEKPEDVVQLDDEETHLSGSSSRESPCVAGPVSNPASITTTSGKLPESGAEEAPICQGCRRRDAQFVCAGCANQWYCSRECQVAAWDEHSEMCSG